MESGERGFWDYRNDFRPNRLHDQWIFKHHRHYPVAGKDNQTINVYWVHGDIMAKGSELVSQWSTKPGIQRDGTDLDANCFNDGLWCRFVRTLGRPKKMGGYKTITQYLLGPIRQLYVWSKQSNFYHYVFGETSVEVVTTNSTGVMSATTSRAPVLRTLAFTATGTTWSYLAGGSSFGFGIKPDGTLWAWGSNTYGQLGDGTTTSRYSPVQVGTATNWSKVAGGLGFAMGIRTDGTLWAWGLNGNGQFGNGTYVSSSTPVQIGVATNWSTVSCGIASSYVRTTANTLYVCGLNDQSQLGDGGTTQNPTLTLLTVGGTTVSKVVAWSQGRTVLALTTTGKIYGWGLNTSGALGTADNLTKTTPTQENSAATDWADIAVGIENGYAIKTNGKLYATGVGAFGSNANAGTGNLNAFTQEALLATTWSKVYADYYSVYGIRTDSTLWAAGYNFNGQLGDSTTTNRTSFTQVGANTALWSSAAGFVSSEGALSTSGILYTWGANASGQLANGITSTSNVTVPTLPLSTPIWSQGDTITGQSTGASSVIAKLTGSSPDYVATLAYTTGTWTSTPETVVNGNGAIGTSGTYTSTAFTGGSTYQWQVDSMYDGAASSDKSIIIAHAANNLANIDDNTLTEIYVGDISDLTKPLEGTGQTVTGGVMALPPYLVTYSSEGKVTWSNANEPLNVYSGDATTARVTGAKVVKGLPLRGGGQSPAALLWSLDSVIKMSFVGGSAVFRFDTLSSQSSVLSSSGFIEYDGVFFWIGIDRFLTFNAAVREIPNTQNIQWFFDNLNRTYAQKVTAIKVPKYGEIWWLFPYGAATENNWAIIYNVRLDTWYDTPLDSSHNPMRSCGYPAQTFQYPVMGASSSDVTSTAIVLTGVTGTFAVGATATGSISGTGTIVRVIGSTLYLISVTGTFAGTVTGSTGGSGTYSSTSSVSLYTLWMHEYGVDKDTAGSLSAIDSYFETSDFGYPTGSIQEGLQGLDRWTRLTRIEPDFVMVGNMTYTVSGKEFAQGNTTTSATGTFTSTTGKIDIRGQWREIRAKFRSNAVAGDYEAGKILVHLEQGDIRS